MPGRGAGLRRAGVGAAANRAGRGEQQLRVAGGDHGAGDEHGRRAGQSLIRRIGVGGVVGDEDGLDFLLLKPGLQAGQDFVAGLGV